MTSRTIIHDVFFGNYFCLMKNYQAAFVAISKNAVTTLKNTVIYSEGLPVPGNEFETHHYIGYSPEKGYLVPVARMEEYLCGYCFCRWFPRTDNPPLCGRLRVAGKRESMERRMKKNENIY